MHLHSLDLLASETVRAPANSIDSGTPSKPAGASQRDEYSLLAQSDGDFVELRRRLVMSPLLDRGSLLSNSRWPPEARQQEELGNAQAPTFEGSIFKQILDDSAGHSAALQDQSHLFEAAELAEGEQRTLSKLEHLGARLKSSSGDSWTKFNNLLLNFLNHYSAQVARAAHSSGPAERQRRRRQQQQQQQQKAREQRRPQARATGSTSGQETPDEAEQQPGAAPSSGAEAQRNYITFACLAQDGNPMNNLTFDWYFGASRLPAGTLAADEQGAQQTVHKQQQQQQVVARSQMLLVHSSPNASLQIWLARRLDTGQQLSPFQMSLLTVSVLVGSSSATTGQTAAAAAAAAPAPAPATTIDELAPAEPNEGLLVQRRQLDLAPSSLNHLQLNEHNWSERLGQLLKCTVSNAIGTSDVCQARVNLAERARRLQAAGSSLSSTLSQWRMPSLAQRSLLIISLLVGCTLIVLASFALLLGPQMHLLQAALGQRGAGKRAQEAAAAAATSCSAASSSACCSSSSASSSSASSSASSSSTRTTSQGPPPAPTTSQPVAQPRPLGHKGSLLGLLAPGGGGNCAELSSDDSDNSSARLQSQQQQQQLQLLRLQQQQRQTARNNRHQPRLIYQPDNGGAFVSATLEPQPPPQAWRRSLGATGSRILASLRLRPLGNKFKVSGGAGDHLVQLHARNLSEATTETTAILEEADGAGQLGSATERAHFGRPNWRHSYSGGLAARRPQANLEAESANKLWSTNSNSSSYATGRLLQLNTQTLVAANERILPNAMDEFLRRRGLDTSTSSPPLQHQQQQQQQMDLLAGYGHLAALASRNQSGQLFALPSELATLQRQRQHQHSAKVAPPVFPRSSAASAANQAHFSTMYHSHQSQSQRQPSSGANWPMQWTQDAYSELQQQHMFQSMRHPRQDAGFQFAHEVAYANAAEMANQPASYLSQAGRMGHQCAPMSTAYDRPPAARNMGEMSRPTEHIYEVNAYATPEQSPMRARQSMATMQFNDYQRLAAAGHQSVGRPRVSQLIQSFDSTTNTNRPTERGRHEENI